MFIVLGLVLAIAAIAAGVAGVAANTSEANKLTSEFSVFDYSFSGTTGELFLLGIAVGLVGGLGVGLVVAGAWRSTRKGVATRRELRRSRREVAAAQKDSATESVARKPAVAVTGRREPVWSANRFLRRPGKGTATAK